jgi:hypothetical protein
MIQHLLFLLFAVFAGAVVYHWTSGVALIVLEFLIGGAVAWSIPSMVRHD